MEADTIYEKPKVHLGRNMRRIREIVGVKQDVIAKALNITQPAVYYMEQREDIDDKTLEKVAEVLNVPVDAIKNYQEDAVVNIIANTFTDCNNTAFGSSPMWYCTFNPFDKIVELYERLLDKDKDKEPVSNK